MDESKLYEWCLEQARRYKEGKLERYRIQKLKDINFPFDYYINELGELKCKR